MDQDQKTIQTERDPLENGHGLATSTNVPNRPSSTTSSITGKVLDIDTETINRLDSPIVPGPPITPTEDDNDDDDEDGSAGYEESAERDEIIRERINKTQEQMR